MPSLGRLEFDLVADNTQLVAAFVQAQAKATQATAAITRAVKAQEMAISQAGTALGDIFQKEAAEATKAAAGISGAADQASKRFQTMKAAAEQLRQPLNQVAEASGKAAKATGEIGGKAAQGLDLTAASALKLGGAMIGATTAIAVTAKALATLSDEARKAIESAAALEAAEARLSKAYGDRAAAMVGIAEAERGRSGTSKATTESLLADNNQLIKSLGLTDQQLQAVMARAGDLAAMNGGTLPEAFKATLAALQGNTKALEEHGVVITESALVAYGGLTEFEAKHLDLLDDQTRAQAILAVVMAQTADAAGAQAAQLDTLDGKLAQLNARYESWGEAIGKGLLPYLEAALDITNEQIDAFDAFIARIREFLGPLGALIEQFGLLDAVLKGIQLTGGPLAALLAQIIERGRQAGDANKDPEQQGPVYGPSPQEVAQAIKDYERAQAAIEKAEKEKNALVAELQIRAAQEQHDREVRRIDALKKLYQDERDARIKAVDEATKATLAAIEFEKRDARAASEARIARLQVEQREAERAADERHTDASRALDEEQRAVKAASDAAIGQKEIERDAWKEAARDRKDAAITAIEEEAYAVKEAFEDELALIQQRKIADQRAAEDARDAAMEALEGRERKEQEKHDKKLARIQKAKDAATEAAEAEKEAALRALDAEIEANDRARELADRALDDRRTAEDRALEDRRRAEDRALDELEDAQDKAHDHVLELFEDEADAAEAKYDAARAATDGLERAEDTRHDAAMQAIADEADARSDLLDLQEAYLDALDDADALAEKLADLEDARASAQAGIGAAESSGNLLEIEKARRKLADVEDDIRDATVKADRDAARNSLDARRKAIEDEQAARERAADEEHDRTLKQVADAGAAAEAIKDAELAAIEVRKAASEAAYVAMTAAADTSVRARRDQLAVIREAEDRALDDRRQAEARALEDQRYAEDQAYAARKVVIEDAYTHERDQIARTYDDPEKGLLAKQKRQADDAAEKYAKRKEKVADAYEDERRQIEDTYDDPVTGLLAKHREMAEDAAHEYGLRKDAVNTAYQEEQDQIKATYDDETTGVIPAMRRAQEAAEEQFRLRKQAVDDAYEHEKEQIRDTYTNEETGLIPLARKAAEELQEKYDAMARSVQAAADRQKEAINAVHDAQIKGLDEARQKADETLKAQQQYWRDWKDGVTGSIEDVIKKYDELIAKIKAARRAGGGSDGGGGDGDDGDPGGGPAFPMPRYGGGIGGGGEYRPVVENASDNSYWTSGGTHGGHPAADIFAPKGSAIRAPIGGTLETATFPLGGNTGILKGDNGRWYYFAHAESKMQGGRVEAGERIGGVGDTGNAKGTSPHLHFAIASDEALFGRWNGSGDIDGDASYWKGHGGPITVVPPGRANGPGNPNASEGEIERYIQQAARARQIDPDIAVRAARTEGKDPRTGKLVPMAVGRFPTGWSFWPFQLHYGGGKYSDWGPTAGMGNDFTAATKYRPNEPANWVPSTDYGLDQARKSGWDKWYGPPTVGITGFMGISRYAKGGMVPEPTLLVGRHSGPYAIAGEAGPEWVGPVGAGAGASFGPPSHVEMPIFVGNREVERVWMDGYRLNVKRGRLIGALGA